LAWRTPALCPCYEESGNPRLGLPLMFTYWSSRA
jgi:hypothetical protein